MDIKKLRATRSKEKENFPERHAARLAVYKAVKSGKLIRPEQCSRCGKICIPQAHHKDYTKPLEVVWLCQDCHNISHGKTKFSVLPPLEVKYTFPPRNNHKFPFK